MMNNEELKVHILSSIDKIAEKITRNPSLKGDEGIRIICYQVQDLWEMHYGDKIDIEPMLSRAIGAYHNPAHFGVSPTFPRPLPPYRFTIEQQRTICAVNFIKNGIAGYLANL